MSQAALKTTTVPSAAEPVDPAPATAKPAASAGWSPYEVWKTRVFRQPAELNGRKQR